MVNINVIIIIKTPFHQKAIEYLFPELFESLETLVMYSSDLKVNNYKCQKYKLKEYNFSRHDIFSNPLKHLTPFRKKIQIILEELNYLKQEYFISKTIKLYFGSDKDIFTQLLVKSLKGNLTEVTAVDEGLAYYIYLSRKDYIVSYLYQILTPILFGQRLFFIKRMGTLSNINTVYLRDVDLLPSKVKGIDYKEFQMKSEQVKKPITKGKVLFFSFPEQDLRYSPEKKIALHLGVAKYLEKHGRKLVIKPHPRENVIFLKDRLRTCKNIIVLNEKEVGENLQYFNYEFIINVFSSIILDIVNSSYPKKKLLTLGYTHDPSIKFDNTLRYIPLDTFDPRVHIDL